MPSGSIGPPPGDGWFSLIRYCHVFSSAVREVLEKSLLHEVSGNGLTLSQFHLLRFVSLADDREMHEVAEFLGVSAPAATKNVDKLERLGLVVRAPSIDDRRVTLLAVTEQGRQLIASFEDLERERLARVVDPFHAEELAEFSKLLQKFSVALIRNGDGQRGDLCLRCASYFDDRCLIQNLHPGCPYQKAARKRGEVLRRPDE